MVEVRSDVTDRLRKARDVWLPKRGIINSRSGMFFFRARPSGGFRVAIEIGRYPSSHGHNKARETKENDRVRAEVSEGANKAAPTQGKFTRKYGYQ